MGKGEAAKPNTKTAAFTMLWLVLIGAAMFFLAVAGHV
jgi:hypothetical protein